jgi:hypothetical protein
MNKKWQPFFRIAGFVLGFAAFFLAVYSIPLREIWAVMRDSFNRYFVLCVSFWMFSIVFQTWRWHVMLRWKKPVPFNGSLKLFVVHRLANLLLPLRAGEGMRIIAARQQFDINIPYLMATSINERILNIAFLIPMALGLTFVIADLQKFQPLLLILFLLFSVGLGSMLWRHRAEISVTTISQTDQFENEGRLARFWRRFSQGIAILKNPRILLGVVFTSLGSWCVLWLATFFLLQNIENQSAALGAWSVLLFTNIASLLPLTPSNLGPFQWGCILALSHFGVPQADAVGFSLVLQAVRITAALLLGAVSLASEFFLSQLSRPADLSDAT